MGGELEHHIRGNPSPPPSQNIEIGWVLNVYERNSFSVLD